MTSPRSITAHADLHVDLGTKRETFKEAWAGNPPAPGGAQERLFDATIRCIIRDGLAATGIASVASEAGVSRPTVYRYFEDRHALIRQALLHAGRAHGEATALHIRRFTSPARKAVEAELFVLGRVPEDPLLNEIWNSATLDATLLRDVTRPATLGIARNALAGLLELVDWNDDEAEEAIEVMLRFLVSLLVAPDPQRSELELRSFLERRLVPALGLDEYENKNATNLSTGNGRRPVPSHPIPSHRIPSQKG